MKPLTPESPKSDTPIVSADRLEGMKMAPRKADVNDVEDLCCEVERLQDIERRLNEAIAERDVLMGLLADIDNRAQRIKEDKAVVGIEAEFIRQVIRRAIESTKRK